MGRTTRWPRRTSARAPRRVSTALNSPARVLRRAAFGGAVALLVLVGSASAASAHATLLSTTPAQSEHFAADAPPTQVTVTFDEGVTATPDSVGVYDGAGKPVVLKPTTGLPRTAIGAALPKLSDGTYVV